MFNQVAEIKKHIISLSRVDDLVQHFGSQVGARILRAKMGVASHREM